MPSAVDAYLPQYHVRTTHAITVRAAPPAVYSAIHAVTSAEIALFRPLMTLRLLLSLLLRRSGAADSMRQPFIAGALRHGFTLLADHPGHEVVLGVVGRFWRPVDTPIPLANPDAFQAFNRPGFAKAVMNFSVAEPPGQGLVLSTETRIYLTSPRARTMFRAYWWLIAPFSGLLRSSMLRAIRRRAEGHTR
jgi:hypothetical protein